MAESEQRSARGDEARPGVGVVTEEYTKGNTGEPNPDAAEESHGNGGAVKRELDRVNQRREADQREAERVVEAQAAATEAHRKRFEGSEQADVHHQIEEAERIMRMPTPLALKRTGAVVGDPTRGPSS